MSEAPSLTTLVAPSIQRRMASWLYEGVLLFGVVFISGVVFFALLYLFGALDKTKTFDNFRIQFMIFLFLVLGIYFSWLSNKGQTLAMQTWHLKVVDKNHHNIFTVYRKQIC